MFNTYIQIGQSADIKMAILHGTNVAALPHIPGPLPAEGEEAEAAAKALHEAAVKIVPHCDLSQFAQNPWLGRAASMFAAWCQIKGHTPETVTVELATTYGENNLLEFAAFL